MHPVRWRADGIPKPKVPAILVATASESVLSISVICLLATRVSLSGSVAQAASRSAGQSSRSSKRMSRLSSAAHVHFPGSIADQVAPSYRLLGRMVWVQSQAVGFLGS